MAFYTNTEQTNYYKNQTEKANDLLVHANKAYKMAYLAG